MGGALQVTHPKYWTYFKQWGITHEHLQITEFLDAIGYKACKLIFCEALSCKTTLVELFLGVSGHTHQLHQHIADITLQTVYDKKKC